MEDSTVQIADGAAPPPEPPSPAPPAKTVSVTVAVVTDTTESDIAAATAAAAAIGNGSSVKISEAGPGSPASGGGPPEKKANTLNPNAKSKGKGKANRSTTRALTRVAAGHQGDVMKETNADGSTGTGFILKKKDPVEAANYEKLFGKAGDPMQRWTPLYGGMTSDESGQEFMRLQNLTSPDYVGAYVLDCKLGVRTFVEKEAVNETLRSDLYKKAFELAPWMLTDEENERQAITKFRWMTIHDKQTTTIDEGWRIDGCAGQISITKKELQKNKTKDDVIKFLSSTYMDLVYPAEMCPEDPKTAITYRIAQTFVQKLREMRDDFQESEFFKSHEFIGTSLLLIADKKAKCGVNMIDLAKTFEIPEKVKDSYDHRRPWELGNHEDGCLFGLDNMINTWELVTEEVLKNLTSQSNDVADSLEVANIGPGGGTDSTPQGPAINTVEDPTSNSTTATTAGPTAVQVNINSNTAVTPSNNSATNNVANGPGNNPQGNSNQVTPDSVVPSSESIPVTPPEVPSTGKKKKCCGFG